MVKFLYILLGKFILLLAMLMSGIQFFFVSFASYSSERLPTGTLFISWILKILLGTFFCSGFVLLLNSTNRIVLNIVIILSSIICIAHLAMILLFKISFFSANGRILYGAMFIYILIVIFFSAILIRIKQ